MKRGNRETEEKEGEERMVTHRGGGQFESGE